MNQICKIPYTGTGKNLCKKQIKGLVFNFYRTVHKFILYPGHILYILALFSKEFQHFCVAWHGDVYL
jgi:hypothetical protein